MSSDSQSAVIYDYVLTFSREVDYIWHRPWTLVSTMFVLVRYLGLSWAILMGLWSTSFVPGPVKMCTWDQAIFLAAADLVMILRVYAMWNRSKRIIFFLLCIYVPQIIIDLVFAGVYYNPNTRLSVTVIPVANLTICNASLTDSPPLVNFYDGMPRLVLSITLFILVVIQTLRQSIQMYKATKDWQPNQFILQLMGDGILYFLVNILFAAALAGLQNDVSINNMSLLFLTLLSYVTICPIMPRFIISLRELHDRGLHVRRRGIDTGFGVPSQSGAPSMIVFADIATGKSPITEETNESEAIRLEVLGNGIHRV
ncbi:hypothetical protein OG21DRAFT_176184 [Imleria badia]|nr:hypothetical protein OG21DRAFT_176184 [Imleria badia]